MIDSNPIDKDKVTDMPGLLQYAHHVGSAIIKPEDSGKIKSKALTAMREQTNMQVKNIYEQMQLLVNQMNDIKKRVEVSEEIYNTEMRFEPMPGHIYHLYRKDDGRTALSIIGPDQWGRSQRFNEFICSVKLLADHTWEILKQ
jgi:hypothetical protein